MFRYLGGVLPDQAVGRIDDILGRTVVPLQLEDLATRIELLELKDIVDIGSAERIDTLCVVAHHTQVTAPFAQTFHNQMLGEVGILILVHQYILEIIAIFFQHVRMIPEQQVRLQQQVIEIHRSGLLATVLIAGINIAHQRDLVSQVIFYQLLILFISLIRDQRILGIRDAALYHPRTIHLVVQLHFLDDRLDQVLRIGRIIDRKIGGESQSLCLPPQDTGKDRMECAHPKPAGSFFSHNPGDTFFHLPGSFVRKCKG